MATTASLDFQAVKAELGRAIRRRRDDCPPVETARLLLSYDGPGQPLVGIRYDGERAVYFDDRGRRAIGVFFDASGVRSREGLELAKLAAATGVDEWAGKTRYYWGWRHPRYR